MYLRRCYRREGGKRHGDWRKSFLCVGVRRGKRKGRSCMSASRNESRRGKIVVSCRKRKQLQAAVGQRVGRLLGKNSRAAGFEVRIDPDTDGFAERNRSPAGVGTTQ